MTPEEQQEKVIEFKALAYYSTPYGKPNPQTYAFIKGYEIACIEKDAQISDLEKRLKEVSAIAVDLAAGK